LDDNEGCLIVINPLKEKSITKYSENITMANMVLSVTFSMDSDTSKWYCATSFIQQEK